MSKSTNGSRRRPRKSYDQLMQGLMGSMGAERTSINFLQLNIPISKIDQIGMVSEIPGSEKWPVRQLFQREIDHARVENEIMPYFLQSDYVKFFNPLTVAVLPVSEDADMLANTVREEEAEPDEDFDKAFAIPGYYKVSYEEGGQDSFATLAWNSGKVRLIAIDGQHRLSALKRLKAMQSQDPEKEEFVNVGFSEWTVPIVLLTMGHAAGEKSAASILEKTRQIFVTINKQAREPSRARTILLNDYSVTALACQETLDYCRESELPLPLFNWRDQYEDGGLYLLGVDDLEDIYSEYLIGSDHEHESGGVPLTLSRDQENALFWEEMTERPEKHHIPEVRETVRKRFNETVLPAVEKLLLEAQPIAHYSKFLSDLDNKNKGEIEGHAWSRLVYGSDYASESLEGKVRDAKDDILRRADSAKSKLGSVFARVVGPRALFSAFAIFYEYYCEAVEVISWAEAADKFIAVYNPLYNDGSIEIDYLQDSLVLDQNSGQIINYRVESVNQAYGAAIAFLVLNSLSYYDRFDLSDLKAQLQSTLIRELKKIYRPTVKDEFRGHSQNEINDEIKRRAQNAAGERISKIIEMAGNKRNKLND